MGTFRKLPTPALPGSGSRVLRSARISAFGAPVFMSVSQYSRPTPKVKPRRAYCAPLPHIFYQGVLRRRGQGMKVEPEQRAALLGSTSQKTAQQCGPQRGRSGAANPPCTRMFRPGCGGWTPTYSSGCRQCWPGTRPSGICGAERPPAGNTAKNKSGGASLYIGCIRVCRFCCYLLRNCSSAAFSSRLTCAWLMPISRATSICVSPLR